MAEFKPNTRYSWEPTEQIILTGQQFSDLFNAVSGFINGFNTPNSIIGLGKGLDILQNKLVEMVQAGTATELIETKE